jgi:hypothetical protein
MAKPEKAKHTYFYILNVKLRNRTTKNDLTEDDYTRIFWQVFQEKIHTESSPNKHCIFRFMFEEKENNSVKYISGTFAQFTYIKNERWFNLESLDIDKEFKTPDGLFPDAKITEFVFIPSAHRFCYKITNDFKIKPYPIKKFIESALTKVTIKNEYVQVDVESDTATLERILSAKEIKKLLIDITYSNTDIGDDLKQFVEDDIRASNTSRLKIEATQKPRISIDVRQSKILTGAIESSVSNGETEATIINMNNKTETIKTSDFPRRESVVGVSAMFKDQVYEKIMTIFRRK